MTYAVGELLIYLISAALLGLMLGYLLWYRRAVVAEAWAIEMTTECDRLRGNARSQTVDAERSAKELEAIRGQVARLPAGSRSSPTAQGQPREARRPTGRRVAGTSWPPGRYQSGYSLSKDHRSG